MWIPPAGEEVNKEAKFIVKMFASLVLLFCLAFVFEFIKVPSNLWTGLLFTSASLSIFAVAFVEDL